jgi:hypothetical protein
LRKLKITTTNPNITIVLNWYTYNYLGPAEKGTKLNVSLPFKLAGRNLSGRNSMGWSHTAGLWCRAYRLRTTIVPRGIVLPATVMSCVGCLWSIGTGACRRNDSLMHRVR